MGDSREKGGRAVLWIAAVAASALVVAAAVGFVTGAYRVGSVAGAATYTINEHRTFPAVGVERVSIGGVDETVSITESPDEGFAVHYTGTATVGEQGMVPKLATSLHAGVLDVRVERRWGFSGFHRSELHLELAVPRGFMGTLDVESVSGAITAAPHSYADFSARTTSGSITLDSLRAASVRAHSVSGNVTARGLLADEVQMATTSGRVDLETASPVIDLHSVSGELAAASTAQPTRVSIGSTSGRVTLRLPTEAQFAIDAHSVSGGVRCDYPVMLQSTVSPRANRLVGTVGADPSGEVRIRTTSGSIDVYK